MQSPISMSGLYLGFILLILVSSCLSGRITLQKIHTGAGVDGDVIGTKPSPTGVRVEV